jgi:adenylate kinase family enzyme
MKRILVIGCSGSGKSTFSKELSHRLNLPLVHLDHLFWKPGWIEREYKIFEGLLQAEIEKKQWIIDGNYINSFPIRIKYADTVIFLDFNRWICTWRVIKRWLMQEGYQAIDCPQTMDWSFLKYVFWDYHGNIRNRALEIKKQYSSSINWITFKDSNEVKKWLLMLN